MAPLSERIDALNYSLDPWERTGAAPQGWANHLQQSMVPIQGIFNYARKQLVLSRFLVPLASRHLEALVILMLLSSLLPGVLGKHPRLLAFSLMILSARTLADTAVVDLVMSELSMMIIRAMIVSSDFCTLRECLVLHGSPH